MNAVGLNHRVAPRLSLTAFFDLAVQLGIKDVEIRNELPGVAIADGTPAETVRRGRQPTRCSCADDSEIA